MKYQFEIRFNGSFMGEVEAGSLSEAKTKAEQMLLEECEYVNGVDEIDAFEDPDDADEEYLEEDEDD